MFNDKKFAHIFAAVFYGVLLIAALVLLILGFANTELANNTNVNLTAFFTSVALLFVPGLYYLEREVISPELISARILVRAVRFALFVILVMFTAGIAIQVDAEEGSAVNHFLVYTFTTGALLSGILESVFYGILYEYDYEGNSKNVISIIIYATPFVCLGIGAALAVLGGTASVAIVLCVYIASVFAALSGGESTIEDTMQKGTAVSRVISTIMAIFGVYGKAVMAVIMAGLLIGMAFSEGTVSLLIYAPLVAIGYAIISFIMSGLLSSKAFREFDPKNTVGFSVFCLAMAISAVLVMAMFSLIPLWTLSWVIGLVLLLASLAGLFIYIFLNSPVNGVREKKDKEDRHEAAEFTRISGMGIAASCESIIKRRSQWCRDVNVYGYAGGDTLTLEIHMYPSPHADSRFNDECQKVVSWVKDEVLKRLPECGCTKVEFEVIPKS